MIRKKYIIIAGVALTVTFMTLMFTKRFQVAKRPPVYKQLEQTNMENPVKEEIAQRLHLSENHNINMEQILDIRKEKLKQICTSITPKGVRLANTWVFPNEGRYIILDKWKHYKVCSVPKAGSSSWKKQAKQLKKQDIKKGIITHILPVRHPLDRLFSAYKDKFLGGLPISKYDSKWRRDTQSGQSWYLRWQNYWLPALISNHRLQHTTHLHREPSVNNLRFNDEVRNTNGHILKSLMDYREIEKYLLNSPKSNNKPFESVLKRYFGSEYNNLSKRYTNVSFTFKEFINHVIWTHNIGYDDLHWTPYSAICDICRKPIDFVLHMENSSQEIPYVLKKLGFHIDEFNAVHKSKNTSSRTSHEEYFNSLPKDLLNAVEELYKYDFEFFK